MVITLVWLYIMRNFGKVVGLESPEPLANLYSRSYFRATWVTTALDAGFWTAMHLRPKWLRDMASMVFSVYYLFCAEQADEKVRNVRSCLTVDHLRVSWNKPSTPYLRAITSIMRPRFMNYRPRALRIPRPRQSSYNEPIHAWLYFNGPLSALKHHTKVVLDIPGGGFVAMSPRDHEDKLLAWAGKTGMPILSINYKKAPEYPYPYALNECYDVYHTLLASSGRCMGLSGETLPQVVVSGDSAGANLAVGMVLMILQAGSTDTRRFLGEQALPPPEGLVLIYPALDVNISSWMSDDQMSLIRDRRMRKTNQGVLRRKSEDYSKLTQTPHQSEEDLDAEESGAAGRLKRDSLKEVTTAIKLNNAASKSEAVEVAEGTAQQTAAILASKPAILKTRLAMTSMISYFNDRILSPEMMRAMVILYVGPHNRPDLATDFLLSPLLAPESLLVHFPKLYLMTGERDPLVDDTVIFAGRIRQAKYAAWLERKEMGLLTRQEEKRGFREENHVEVTLIPGISHGFLQFVSVFPEGWDYIFRCARWMREIFALSDARAAQRAAGGEDESLPASPPETRTGGAPRRRHHQRTNTGASSADDERPLEMSMIRPMSKRKSNSGPVPTIDGDHLQKTESHGRKARDARGMDEGEELKLKKTKSLLRLGSQEDILARRMLAMTDGLTGGIEVNEESEVSESGLNSYASST